MAERKIQPPAIESIRTDCEQLLHQVINQFSLSSSNPTINLLADNQEPIRAKAYQFTEMEVDYDSDQGSIYLNIATLAGLKAQASFLEVKENQLKYSDFHVLNTQKNPPKWEAPTSSLAEQKILEAANIAIKQVIIDQVANFSAPKKNEFLWSQGKKS